MERAHVWVWHEKLEGRQPETLSQPPPATAPHRQADSLPELLAHGQQRTKIAECFATLISRINVRTAPAL